MKDSLSEYKILSYDDYIKYTSSKDMPKDIRDRIWNKESKGHKFILMKIVGYNTYFYSVDYMDNMLSDSEGR